MLHQLETRIDTEHERLRELEAENAELRADNAELRERVERIETMLAAISGPLSTFTPPPAST